jgi:hypothetical protein
VTATVPRSASRMTAGRRYDCKTLNHAGRQVDQYRCMAVSVAASGPSSRPVHGDAKNMQTRRRHNIGRAAGLRLAASHLCMPVTPLAHFRRVRSIKPVRFPIKNGSDIERCARLTTSYDASKTTRCSARLTLDAVNVMRSCWKLEVNTRFRRIPGECGRIK